jgi:hypothetical protein
MASCFFPPGLLAKAKGASCHVHWQAHGVKSTRTCPSWDSNPVAREPGSWGMLTATAETTTAGEHSNCCLVCGLKGQGCSCVCVCVCACVCVCVCRCLLIPSSLCRRCLGEDAASRIVCMKAGEKGFYGSTVQGGTENTFELPGTHGCHHKHLNPHFGLWPLANNNLRGGCELNFSLWRKLEIHI